ncbi:MAG: hypothetical protein LUG16_02090 [Candidatus Gastranaerophilales bacterium]|nr:hypothetical protein [Candidatus Gastranaerophilales bacterium]
MEFKTIDSKMKEIYYTPQIITNEETEKSDFAFWNSMHIIAMQNITMQNIKMA